MRPPLRFGLLMNRAARTWDEIPDGFLLADELGFDHGWPAAPGRRDVLEQVARRVIPRLRAEDVASN